MQHGVDGGHGGYRYGAGRQAFDAVCVVRRVNLKVAVQNAAQSRLGFEMGVDDGRAGLESHAAFQTVDIDSGYKRHLTGVVGLAYDYGC